MKNKKQYTIFPNFIAVPLAILARYYTEWYNGVSFDFKNGGEEQLLSQLSEFGFLTIFDVGANVGKWTQIALKKFPQARVHAFELSPDTFKILSENVRSGQVVLNNYGLSDTSGPVEFKDYGVNSGVSTLLTQSRYHEHKKHKLSDSTVQTGDKYCQENSIERIDFLKIDVEGAERKVLMGLREKLFKGLVRVVQFEYAYANADDHFLMRDFFEFFDELGYRVGKVRRDGIVFEEWNYEMNDFDSGPNFIAVKRDDIDLIARISV